MRAGRALAAFLVALSSGVRGEYAGQFEREEATGSRFFLLGIIAVLGISLILFPTLRSVRPALIVLVNLPFALAGVVVGMCRGEGILSISSVIVFITRFGIATRNGCDRRWDSAPRARGEGKGRCRDGTDDATRRVEP